MTDTADTPTYFAIVADRGFNPGGMADYSRDAVEARSTPADAERGRAIVARLEGGDG